MVARIDSAILHEIARIVQTRSKVPDRLRLVNREFQITYLEDHRQRMEDALRRHDSHLLNMLFGQLASKVKYQQLRAVRGAATSNGKGGATATTAKPIQKRNVPAKAAAVKVAPKKQTAKKPLPKKASVKKGAAKKAAPPRKGGGGHAKAASTSRSRAVTKRAAAKRKK